MWPCFWHFLVLLEFGSIPQLSVLLDPSHPGPTVSGRATAAQQLVVSGAQASVMSLLTCSVSLPAWHGVLRCGDRVLGGGKRSLSWNWVFYR